MLGVLVIVLIVRVGLILVFSRVELGSKVIKFFCLIIFWKVLRVFNFNVVFSFVFNCLNCFLINFCILYLFLKII